MSSTIFTITETEARQHPFWCGFYPLVCRHLGEADYDKVVSLKCTKIEICKELQDLWYDMVTDRYPNEPAQEVRTSLTMSLLMSGPKVNEELRPELDYFGDGGYLYQIKVEDGFMEVE